MTPSHKPEMEIELKDPFIFTKIFNITKNEIKDCVLEFAEDGVRSQTMDSSHVSLMAFFLDKNEYFEKYKLIDGPFKIGFSITNFLYVMKLADKQSKISMAVAPGSDTITISVLSNSNTFQFDLTLMNIDCDEFEIPYVDDYSIITFPVSLFSGFIKKTEDGIDITMGISEDNLMYNIKTDMGEMFGKLSGGVISGSQATCQMKLSMKFIKSYCQVPSDLCKEINLCFKEDCPLCFVYKLGENSNLTFYISPKFEDEDQ